MTGRAALEAAQRSIQEIGSSARSLCEPCMTVLPVSGMSVATLSGPINNDTVCASDDIAHRLDELQFDLGEGPCWEAFASRRPVLVPDLRQGSHREWPVFAELAQETPAAAIFAFPLYVGWTGVGSMDLYCTDPGPLEETTLRDAGELATTIAVELMRRILETEQRPDQNGMVEGDPWRSWPSSRRLVHQATGMLIDQLDVSAGAAFARLRAHAFAVGTPVTEVAKAILAGDLRFQRDNP